MAQKSVATAMNIGELSRLLKDHAGLTQLEFESLLRNFGLQPREHWDVPPPGFRDKDMQPWRFRRPLSLLARPLILLGKNPEDNVLYAAGLLHAAFGYTVASSYLGQFDQGYFRTPAMRGWIGDVNNRKGHDFNSQVAEEFRRNSFMARASVSMSEFSPAAELGDLGDVDALAWTKEGLVYIVECKNLRFAVTIGEIAEQLRRFKGDARDELDRHLKRFNWLREHLEALSHVISVRDKPLTLRPLLVTNTIVPMQFKNDLPISAKEIVPFSQLSAVVGPPTGRRAYRP